MQKGKYGICLPFYAALGLVLAFLEQTVLCALLLGFVIVAEKDQWAGRQTMQAFFVSLFMSLVRVVLNILNVFDDIPFIGRISTIIFSAIEGVISLLVLIFLIIGLIHVLKGKDAGIPLLSKLANRAYGIVEQKIYTQSPPSYPNQTYQSPANGASPQDPNQPQQ